MKTQTHISPKMRNIAIFLAMGCIIIGCSTVNKWCGFKDDNVIENLTEDAVECTTGLQIDLTPESQDDGFHIYDRK